MKIGIPPKFFIVEVLSNKFKECWVNKYKKLRIDIIVINTVTLRFSKCDKSFDRPFDKLRVTIAKVYKNQKCTICNFPQRFLYKRFIHALFKEYIQNYWDMPVISNRFVIII